MTSYYDILWPKGSTTGFIMFTGPLPLPLAVLSSVLSDVVGPLKTKVVCQNTFSHLARLNQSISTLRKKTIILNRVISYDYATYMFALYVKAVHNLQNNRKTIKNKIRLNNKLFKKT